MNTTLRHISVPKQLGGVLISPFYQCSLSGKGIASALQFKDKIRTHSFWVLAVEDKGYTEDRYFLTKPTDRQVRQTKQDVKENACIQRMLDDMADHMASYEVVR